MSKVTPCLWFANGAEEAARFYVSLLPSSRIDSVTTMPAETPSGPPGSVVIVEFTLGGESYMAMQAGPLDPFNHAVSFSVDCEDQAEIDRIWDAHLANGGTAEQCGWLRDRWGVAWQIVPGALGRMVKSPDRAAAKRAAEAMLGMVKLDLATLQAAFEDRAGV